MGLRAIPTSVHGVLDYATGATLLAAPGPGALAYGLLTDYEPGLVGLVPMPAHLALDALSGAPLASSPWPLGFAGGGPRHWLPHVCVGATEVLAAASTKTRRGDDAGMAPFGPCRLSRHPGDLASAATLALSPRTTADRETPAATVTVRAVPGAPREERRAPAACGDAHERHRAAVPFGPPRPGGR